MLVVNLFGAPGAGKSTGAAFIFARLKMAGVNAEYIQEFAKDKAWEKNPTPFKVDNQNYLFAKQSYRMERCREDAECLVTDSPLPLCVHYNESDILGEPFNQMVMNSFDSYENMSYFVHRVKPYNPKGRRQTEAQSDAMSDEIRDMLLDKGIPFKDIYGCEPEYAKVAAEVFSKLRGYDSDYLLGNDVEPGLK